jgi:hypothetical protein
MSNIEPSSNSHFFFVVVVVVVVELFEKRSKTFKISEYSFVCLFVCLFRMVQ